MAPLHNRLDDRVFERNSLVAKVSRRLLQGGHAIWWRHQAMVTIGDIDISSSTNVLKTRNVQTIAIFDTIHFGLRKRWPIFQADFINIHVTNACTLVKCVNFELNSFVNHTTPLCLQNMHMLYLRMWGSYKKPRMASGPELEGDHSVGLEEGTLHASNQGWDRL